MITTPMTIMVNDITGDINPLITSYDNISDTYNIELIPEVKGDLFPTAYWQTLDGINEYGLVCNTNVTAAGDVGITTGTNPGAPGLPQMLIPRLILDKAQTVQEAIKILSGYNITGMKYNGDTRMELHFMVADASETAIIEFIDNQTVVTYPEKPVMTNFYTSIAPTPHSSGLERAKLLTEAWDGIDSRDDMKAAMESVHYTNAYDRTQDPFWYSEFVGETKTFGNLTIWSKPEDFTGIVDYCISEYEKHDRSLRSAWQTTHMSIYEMPEKELDLYVQENFNTKYTYNFQTDFPEEATKETNYLWKIKTPEFEIPVPERLISRYAGCSSCRKGDYYGRNYDWYYSEEATMVIKTDPIPGVRYGSIGISGCCPDLPDSYFTSGKPFADLPEVDFKISGVTTSKEKVQTGKTTEIEAPEVSGYEFTGWSDGVKSRIRKVSGETTLKAIYEKQS